MGPKQANVESKPGESPRTATLPEGQRSAFLDGPDEVTGLRIYTTGRELAIPNVGKTFSIGSAPNCDASIQGDYLSALHCMVERRPGALRVRDHGSRNGTFYGGRRELVFDVRPGETFQCASLRFLVLNDAMREAYPVLVEIMGAADEHGIAGPDVAPSDLVVAATQGANLLLTGEAGCDQDRLDRRSC